jgi:hypothetical protein
MEDSYKIVDGQLRTVQSPETKATVKNIRQLANYIIAHSAYKPEILSPKGNQAEIIKKCQKNLMNEVLDNMIQKDFEFTRMKVAAESALDEIKSGKPDDRHYCSGLIIQISCLGLTTLYRQKEKSAFKEEEREGRKNIERLKAELEKAEKEYHENKNKPKQIKMKFEEEKPDLPETLGDPGNELGIGNELAESI